MNQEEEFARLRERWEIARALLKEENDLINHRTNKIYLTSSFLLGAYGLIFFRSALTESAEVFVWVALLLGFLATAGIVFSYAIQKEIGAAVTVIQELQQWWEEVLLNAGRIENRWFPPLRFADAVASQEKRNGRNLTPEQIEKLSERHFRTMRILMPSFWSFVLLITLIWGTYQYRHLHTQQANQKEDPRATSLADEPPQDDIAIDFDMKDKGASVDGVQFVGGIVTGVSYVAVAVAIGHRLDS